MNIAAMDLARLKPGFADPVHDAQNCFRVVLDALARPGRILTLPVRIDPPTPLSAAQTALLLTLADVDTPLWLAPEYRDPAVSDFLRFHTGAPLVDSLSAAHFVVLRPLALPELSTLRLGELDYPDRSATLIVEVPRLDEVPQLRLRGPGIAEVQHLDVAGWTAAHSEWHAGNRALFPRGVDLVFTCGERLAGLPRTTLVEAC